MGVDKGAPPSCCVALGQPRSSTHPPYVLPYNLAVRKSSVYLTEQQARRLAHLARAEGRPQAEVLRDAIGSYRPRSNHDRDFALDGCVTGRGDSVADVDEDELLRGFGA